MIETIDMSLTSRECYDCKCIVDLAYDNYSKYERSFLPSWLCRTRFRCERCTVDHKIKLLIK